MELLVAVGGANPIEEFKEYLVLDLEGRDLNPSRLLIQADYAHAQTLL